MIAEYAEQNILIHLCRYLGRIRGGWIHEYFMQGFWHSRPVEEPFSDDVYPERFHKPVQNSKAKSVSSATIGKFNKSLTISIEPWLSVGLKEAP